MGMPMDVWQAEDGFHVSLDLPGVDPSSVDITTERNVLTITAERRPEYQQAQNVLVAERPQEASRDSCNWATRWTPRTSRRHMPTGSCIDAPDHSGCPAAPNSSADRRGRRTSDRGRGRAGGTG